MLMVTFADLRYRYRQFLIAVVGAGVVLAMAILMAGLAGGFRAEINRTVGAARADAWVMTNKSAGRLTSGSTFSQALLSKIGREPGVTHAAGFILLPQEVLHRTPGTSAVTAGLIGVTPGRVGSPLVTSGRTLDGRGGEAVVDRKTGLAVGDGFRIGSLTFRVVGSVADRTIDGGLPSVYVALHDAQRVAFGGAPLVTAVATRGVPRAAPPGLRVLSNSTVETQTLQALSGAVSSIENARTLMWAVATIIVAALVYVSALQRVRDFAVLKALGSTSRTLFASLCLQSVIVTLVAAAFGAAICNLLKGVFNQPIAIPTSAFVTLPLVAIVVGLLSSLVALRTATGADPAAAFGG